jgi:plastocyanin
VQRLSLPAIAVLAVLVLVACTGGPAASASQPASPSSAASGPAGTPAATTCADAETGEVAVTIENNTFSPDPVTATVGQAIQWTNADAVPHTATLDDGDCGTDQLAQGATAALVFNVAGSYPYHCEVHPTMTGTITITE